jgi:hypothetical protein
VLAIVLTAIPATSSHARIPCISLFYLFPALCCCLFCPSDRALPQKDLHQALVTRPAQFSGTLHLSVVGESSPVPNRCS